MLAACGGRALVDPQSTGGADFVRGSRMGTRVSSKRERGAVRTLRILLGCLFGVLGCGSPPVERAPTFSEARAFNPLGACTTTNFGRYTRGVSCRDTHILFISREMTPAALLEHKRKSLLAYGLAAEPRSLLVGGRELPALGYYMGSFEAAAVAVLSTPLDYYGSEESIEALCYHFGGPVDPKRCASLLDAFVAQGITRGEWPSVLSPRDPQAALSFDVLGRAVRLPGSCDELGPFDAECKEGHVSLLILEEPAQLPRALAADQAVGVNGTLLSEWNTPCSVEGVDLSCNVRRYRVPFDELFVYRAAVEVRGTPVLLSCATRKSQSPRLPGGVCSQFLGFEPEALLVPELPDVGE
jgi:hypothetical protein